MLWCSEQLMKYETHFWHIMLCSLQQTHIVFTSQCIIQCDNEGNKIWNITQHSYNIHINWHGVALTATRLAQLREGQSAWKDMQGSHSLEKSLKKGCNFLYEPWHWFKPYADQQPGSLKNWKDHAGCDLRSCLSYYDLLFSLSVGPLDPSVRNPGKNTALGSVIKPLTSSPSSYLEGVVQE